MAQLWPMQAAKLTSLRLMLSEPAWFRIQLQPGWSPGLASLTLGPSKPLECWLQGVSEPPVPHDSS